MSKLLFLAAIAGLAISLVAQSPPPSPTPTVQTQNEQKLSTAKQNNGAKTPAKTVGAITSDIPSERQNSENGQRSTNRRIDFLAWVVAAAAVAQFIAMLVQAHYMRRGLRVTTIAADAARQSANAAEDSVVLARKNMHLDQRAWVAPDEVITERGSHQPTTATVLLKNTGKTFAKQCFVSSQLIIKALTDADPDFDTLTQKAEKIELGTIAPNGRTRCQRHALGQLNDTAAVVLIFGKVKYKDVFDFDHWTKFCYRVRESSGGLPSVEVEIYGSYNNAH